MKKIDSFDIFEGKNFDVKLDSDMIFAIKLAFDELSNSGEWTHYYKSKELDKFNKGETKLRQLLNKK